MLLKGALKESSSIIQLFIFLAILTFGLLFCTLASQLFIAFRFNLPNEAVGQIMVHLDNYPNLLRIIQLFQVIGVFIFPAIICAWLFDSNYKSYLQINTPIDKSIIALTILSILILIPFINLTQIINQQMVLPDWMKGLEDWMMQQEEIRARTLEKMLYTDKIWVFIVNVIIVCVLAGIGEEFIFRGILQRILDKGIRNIHIVIWSVAIIFSAIHLQFYGFLPRLLLGAYFGYLLLYTKNMWVPVIAHFTYNFITVLTFYIYQDSPAMQSQVDAVGTGNTWWLGIASLFLFFFLFTFIKQKGAKL